MKIEVMYSLTDGDKSVDIGPFSVKADSFASAPGKYHSELHAQAKREVMQALSKAVSNA